MRKKVYISGVLKDHIYIDSCADHVIMNIETRLVDHARRTVIVKGTLGKAMAHRLQSGQVLSVQGLARGDVILAEWIRLI